MEPEIKDKSNNCETEETPMDSSPLNNNNVLKEGVKKVLAVNNVNEDECAMEVDKDEQPSPSDESSEKKNGVLEESNNSENQKTDEETNNEKITSKHEPNNVDKDLSSDSLNNKESDCAKECKANEETKCDEQEQNAETVSNTTDHVDDHKKESESNGQPESSEKSIDVDAPSDKDSPKNENSTVTPEKDSTKDNVRPDEKGSDASSEPPVSESAVDSSKTDSSDKETKDISNSEVTDEVKEDKSNEAKESKNNEAAESKNNEGTESKSNEAKEGKSNEAKESTSNEAKESTSNDTKESKSKEANESTSSETKTESTKKEGETKKKRSKICEECGAKKGLKFQVLFKGKTRFLCSDTCFSNFKTKQMQAKPPEEAAAPPPPPAPPVQEKTPEKCAQCQKEFSGDHKYYPVVGETKPLCSEECIKKYQTENVPAKNCSQCKKVIENPQNPDILTWETMVFCNEDCLGKYQSYLGSHCTCCQSPVPQASLGKYSVCFGADIRQFCSCSCLDDFKKNLKVCSFCQTDLSAGIDSFLAPVGDKGQFKDFCSQNCMERYEVMNNISKNTPQTQLCSHCKKQGSFKIQVKYDSKTYSLCGDLCVAGFRCAHKINDKMCYTCFNFFNMTPEKDKEFSFKFDGQFKQFCTKACMTLFVLSHRRIVACVSCKVKKYNFDMIEKIDSNNQTQIFCSLNCLSLYRVSVNAVSSKSFRCDNCTKTLPAQYHLTMSDGSVRNFCTYNCVMLFQNQYTNVCTITTTSATRQTAASVSTTTSKTSTAANTPVISNVVSLAPATPRNPGPTAIIRNIVPPKLVPSRQPIQPLAIIGSKIYSLAPSSTVVSPVISQTVPPKQETHQQSTLLVNNDSKTASSTITSPSTLTNASGQQVIREVIVKPPAPKSQKNKSVACKPIMQNKGINVKPQPCHKAVQTDDSPRPILLPIPVPYYVPVPVHMFSRPVPCPMPFPVPMFVPIIVPPKDSTCQDRLTTSGEKSDKRSEEGYNSIKDGKEGSNSQKENDEKHKDKSSFPMRVDDPSSSTSDEYNDANEYEDDEYVFKDGKSHHHGKRHASHQNKGRKKSRMDDTVVDDSKSHNVVSADENRNSSVQNDHLEPVPRLKVP